MQVDKRIGVDVVEGASARVLYIHRLLVCCTPSAYILLCQALRLLFEHRNKALTLASIATVGVILLCRKFQTLNGYQLLCGGLLLCHLIAV